MARRATGEEAPLVRVLTRLRERYPTVVPSFIVFVSQAKYFEGIRQECLTPPISPLGMERIEVYMRPKNTSFSSSFKFFRVPPLSRFSPSSPFPLPFPPHKSYQTHRYVQHLFPLHSFPWPQIVHNPQGIPSHGLRKCIIPKAFLPKAFLPIAFLPIAFPPIAHCIPSHYVKKGRGIGSPSFALQEKE